MSVGSRVGLQLLHRGPVRPRCEKSSADRRVDGAVNGNAVFHVGDVDREVPVAGDEAAGSVQGIDDEKATVARRLRIGLFLADDGGVWKTARQTLENQPVRGEIRFGDRAGVRLAPPRDRPACADLHDLGARIQDQVPDCPAHEFRFRPSAHETSFAFRPRLDRRRAASG